MDLMEWVEKHQYTRLRKTLWTCWCFDEGDEPTHFKDWNELKSHLKVSLTKDVLGKAVSDEKVISAWRAAYDDNEFDMTWQHNADAAIVVFVSVLLGVDDIRNLDEEK